MNSVTNKNFGILIAFLVPGFIATLGIAYQSPTLNGWIGQSQLGQSPTLGGFLIVTIVSVFVGLSVSTVRWAVIDQVHHWTGVTQPRWDFGALHDRMVAFESLIEIHYRFYQFYGNSLIAIPIFCGFRWWHVLPGWFEVFSALCLWIIFFLGSRDTLKKYYRRVESLLETP